MIELACFIFGGLGTFLGLKFWESVRRDYANRFLYSRGAKTRKPACAEWSIWLGREIEGYLHRNERTIFIRDLKLYSIEELAKLYPSIKRIWFCRDAKFEHGFVENFHRAQALFDRVCVESFYDDPPLPHSFDGKYYHYIYIPMRHPWNKWTHLAIGEGYCKEFFLCGRGRISLPLDYDDDIRIL